MKTWAYCLLLAPMLAIFGGCAKATAERAEMPPSEVEVSSPLVRDVTDYEEFTGRLEAPDTVMVQARVSGYLDKINFVDGAEVKAGEVLLEIDPRPYKAQLDQDRADLKNKKAVAVQKEANFKRISRLYTNNSASREDYENLNADFEVAVAAVAQAEAKILQSELNHAWTKVTAQVSGRASRAMVTRGNLVVADKTQLTSIVSIDPMYAYFYVDERTLQRLRTDAQSRSGANSEETVIPVELGLAFEDGYSLKGVLNFEDNRVDNSTGTISMRGIFTNPKLASGGRLLSPGMFARVRLTMGAPRKAILISDRAIGSDQGKKFVYVVKEVKDEKTGVSRQAAERRYVQLGTLHKGLREIKEAVRGEPLPLSQRVSPDEKVVISGLQRIRPGVGVTATDIAMPTVASK